MRKVNVVFIVLDTLREDYAQGLEELVGLGFTRCQNMIAPSVWTLPSHVSMFTGELPSSHGVHESFGTYTNELMEVSRRSLRSSEGNLLAYLKELGYTTYGASANPMIAPAFGFEFDQYSWFDHAGEVDSHRLHRLFLTQNETSRQKSFELIREGELRFLASRAVQTAVDGIRARIKSERLEKGSKRILDHVRSLNPAAPFFLFINLVEAHEPYWWGMDNVEEVAAGVLGRPMDVSGWKEAYPRHSALGVARALAMVQSVMKYDPLIIVASDHGQLIGEEGRVGHVYFLEDSLLKVPFYVRMPSESGHPEMTQRQCSLAEVPKVVRGAVQGERVSLGQRYVLSESFGSHLDLTPYAKPADRTTLNSIYRGRVRVLSNSGSVIVDRDSKKVEFASPGLSGQDVEDSVAQVPEVRTAPGPEGAETFTKEDRELIVGRLRDLGYE